ncbi:ubiquitin carboxyl-terminal hydrolase 47-like isoform X2 [Salvelinus fontinalis]|uniref:ubiquitin carboxyl-terminal hydrolase 47-like isoform X2 n=1 Tax=Salvelinus fontinalis TaxID=8038 RepID=UPI0024855675|nr:ubiquitin carboxyl-terminal hydrolase 47-like isoform X2 [Salvelinus fontinalis]
MDYLDMMDPFWIPQHYYPNEKVNTDNKTILYYGLHNQGATCYLNSVLQVLFMTKGFREAVESQEQVNVEQNTFDLQLKCLFETLKKKQTHTKDVTSKLGIEKVFEQGDAAEYFEKILNKVNPAVSKIFQGHLRHTATCSLSDRHVNSDEVGPFWTVPLSMEDNNYYSVRDGFEDFFKSSTVSGDNQIYCDYCDGKTDAILACEMECPPEILTLLLKRFQFDYHRMSYVKIESCVEVPHTLQTKDCDYELYAVVDHVGGLRGGHYTARIKSYQNHNWYVFDDSYVTQLISKPFEQDESFRSQSAYLLMYRKLDSPDRQMNHETDHKSSFSDSQQSTPSCSFETGASGTSEEKERKVQSNQSINPVDLVGRTDVVPEERQKDDGKVVDMIRQMNIKDRSVEDNVAATDDKDNYLNGEKEQKVGDDVVGQKEQEGEVANVEVQMNDERSREEGMTRKYHGVKGELEKKEEGGQNQRDKPKKREVTVVDVMNEAGQNQRDKARKREDIVVDVVDEALQNQRDKARKREDIVVDVVDEAGQNQRDKPKKREVTAVDVVNEAGQNQRDKAKKREDIVVHVVDEAGQNQRDKARKREDIVVDVDNVLENGTEGDVMNRKDVVVTDRDGDNNERKRNRDGAAKTKPGRIVDDTGDDRTAEVNGGELKTIQVEVAKLGEDCDVTTMSQTNHSKYPSSVGTFQNRLTATPEETTTCFCFKRKRKGGVKISEHDKRKKWNWRRAEKVKRRVC